MSVRLSLKILVITEPVGFYSSGNISTGPVVVLSYFLGNPPTQQKKIFLNFFRQLILNMLVAAPEVLNFFFNYLLGKGRSREYTKKVTGSVCVSLLRKTL